jgi:hypothetical protein
LWVIFALLDPDSGYGYGYGSTDRIQSGSGPETLLSFQLIRACTVIGYGESVWVRLYEGLFKVIPLEAPELKAHNIRIPEIHIFDIKAQRIFRKT